MTETLTLMQIYEAARSTFIQDYNFQQEQCEKMKKFMKSDPEHKERYEKMLSIFEKYKKESSDKILYMMELIRNEQEKQEQGQIICPCEGCTDYCFFCGNAEFVYD